VSVLEREKKEGKAEIRVARKEGGARRHQFS